MPALWLRVHVRSTDPVHVCCHLQVSNMAGRLWELKITQAKISQKPAVTCCVQISRGCVRVCVAWSLVVLACMFACLLLLLLLLLVYAVIYYSWYTGMLHMHTYTVCVQSVTEIVTISASCTAWCTGCNMLYGCLLQETTWLLGL